MLTQHHLRNMTPHTTLLLKIDLVRESFIIYCVNVV